MILTVTRDSEEKVSSALDSVAVPARDEETAVEHGAYYRDGCCIFRIAVFQSFSSSPTRGDSCYVPRDLCTLFLGHILNFIFCITCTPHAQHRNPPPRPLQIAQYHLYSQTARDCPSIPSEASESRRLRTPQEIVHTICVVDGTPARSIQRCHPVLPWRAALEWITREFEEDEKLDRVSRTRIESGSGRDDWVEGEQGEEEAVHARWRATRG